MTYLALVLIVCGFCGILAVGGWIAERRKPDSIARYQSRWPKTSGFRGY